MSRWRTIGVIGGMGPAATVDFLAKLLVASGATRDQDHPRILVDCDPTIPDRNAALRGDGPLPEPRLAEMAQGLERAGSELLAMPCNTAHAWLDGIRGATALPVVSMLDAVVSEARQRAPNARRIGLLQAEGCALADLYTPVFAAVGIVAVAIPTDRLMPLVWRIKAGDLGPEVRAGMAALAADLIDGGAEAIVAACTEVPLVLTETAVPLIDSTAALARASIVAARL